MQRDFDDLARDMASGQTRRGTLKQLLLGAVGIPAVAIGGFGLSEAEAKKNKKNKDKNKNKKVTLCHNGQTITVAQKAKKKHLKHGDTIGPCQDTPSCTPEANPCGSRECGSVTNNCGVQVPCGECTAPEICNTNTGQCGCTPIQNPCGNRQCGSVDNGCGTPVSCGTCNNAITNCQERTCTNGQCGVRNLPAGTSCDDGNACTTGTTCQNNGVCGGGTVVTCTTPPSVCQVSTGTCNPTTGDCQYQDLPNNTPCGMNKCNNTCQNGQCVNTPVTCEQPLNECQEVICDPNNGTCGAPVAANQGEPCLAGTGMCVNGTCEVTNTGTTTCTGANPCLPATYCNLLQTCLCYSTIEGAGFCIDRDEAVCPAEEVRPTCSSSDECGDASVCVPLKETADSTTSCCPSGQFPGFCVPLSARCEQAV